MIDQISKDGDFWLIKPLFALVLVTLCGCSRPNPNPETLDPIYADLNSRAAVAKSAAESAKEEIKTLREELSKLPARDPGVRKAKEDIARKEVQRTVAEQDALYYEIRATQRKRYAQEEYLKAFDKGETWPDPKNFEDYKLERKLREAPREWSNKIPKNDRYNRQSTDDLRKKIDEKLKTNAPAH